MLTSIERLETALKRISRPGNSDSPIAPEEISLVFPKLIYDFKSNRKDFEYSAHLKRWDINELKSIDGDWMGTFLVTPYGNLQLEMPVDEDDNTIQMDHDEYLLARMSHRPVKKFFSLCKYKLTGGL